MKFLPLVFLSFGFVTCSSHPLRRLASEDEAVKPITEVFAPAIVADAKSVKVAVVQWAPVLPTPLGVDPATAEVFKARNRSALEGYIREAAGQGAKLVITPEFAVVGYPDLPDVPAEEDEYRNADDIRPYVETVPGPSTDYFAKVASELGIYLHIGFAEVDPVDGKFYNVVVALDPQGQIVGKYRKINLYEGETNFLSPGSKPATYESPFGRVGLAICADIYSSHPISAYRRQKVDVIALSTSWAQFNTGMEYFRDAARRGRFYVLAANQNYFPDSGVIDPRGSIQSHIRQSDGVAYGVLPLKNVAR